MTWRILICDGLAPEGKAVLAAKAEVHESDSLEILDTVDALIVRSRTKVTAEAQARAGIDIATEVLAALHGEALRWRVA
jgi:phosphoglycerate dehydrogenase-like enzyme